MAETALVEKRPRRRLLVPALAALSVGTIAGAWARRVGSRGVVALSETAVADTTETVVSGTSIRIYKRTHASANALADAQWTQDNLGFLWALNQTYTCSSDSPGYVIDKGPCAERMIMTVIGDWDMHYYQSYVTPMWPLKVKDWVDEWVAGTTDLGWNQWTHMGVTFFAPGLSPFLARWHENGVASIRRRFTEAASGATVYSARVVVPDTGHVVEVVSDAVGDAWEASFEAYADDECGAAGVPTRSIASMKRFWAGGGGEMENPRGLPDLLVVHVTQPVEAASELGDLGDYVKTYSGAGVANSGAVGEACGFAEFAIPFGSFENDFMGAGDGLYDVPIRSIWNAEARQTTHSAGFYASYMAKAMDALMGENRAFSRYADWHIGVMMLANDDAASYTTQQANAAALARDGVGFHNGGNDGDGSNWSRGTSGLGVEFHGHYGLNDTIRGEYDGDINYCAPNAFAQGDDLWCPLHYDALCDDRCD